MPRALDFIAGGWQLSGALQRQSGQPIDWGQMIITGDSTKLVLPVRPAQRRPLVQHRRLRTQRGYQVASNLRTFPLRFSNVRFDSQRRWDFS